MKALFEHNWFFITIGIFIALIGIIIQKTRSYNLIAGYNTMSAEKRKKVNIEQAAIAIRNAFILLGVIWIIIPVISDLSGLSKIKGLFLVVLHLSIITYLIIIVNTRDKYKQ
jgi:hypothetical protein